MRSGGARTTADPRSRSRRSTTSSVVTSRRASSSPPSREALDRFILFEEPDSVAAARQAPLGFDTIGGLYRRVETLITELDHRELFLGDRASQVGPALADFPGLGAITDQASAIAAVERIVEQGEGTRADRVDSHLGVFRTIRDQLDEVSVSWGEFTPARPVLSNPVTARRAGQAVNANVITNDGTARLAELFDGTYTLMLALLGAAFAHDTTDTRGELAHVGIGLMPTVLRPVAESLTRLPATGEPIPTAGPPFFVSRFLPLPPDPDITQRSRGRATHRPRRGESQPRARWRRPVGRGSGGPARRLGGAPAMSQRNTERRPTDPGRART